MQVVHPGDLSRPESKERLNKKKTTTTTTTTT